MPTQGLVWFAITADDTNGGSGSGKLAAGTYNVPNYFLELEAFHEVTWTIQVESVSGAPATWSITPTAQSLVPHTTGDQFSAQAWLPFTAAEQVGRCVEGLGWPTISNAGAVPFRVSRSYRGFGFGMGLSLLVATSGGSSPTVNTTVTYTAKG